MCFISEAQRHLVTGILSVWQREKTSCYGYKIKIEQPGVQVTRKQRFSGMKDDMIFVYSAHNLLQQICSFKRELWLTALETPVNRNKKLSVSWLKALEAHQNIIHVSVSYCHFATFYVFMTGVTLQSTAKLGLGMETRWEMWTVSLVPAPMASWYTVIRSSSRI